MADVVLERLSKVFPNGTHAVVDLSLQIADGELLVLIGPSGCGKTTTLRLIAGLEAATSGTVHIGGRSVNTLPPRERNVAMVFQRSTLYPHLDVRHNLSMGLRLRREGGLRRLLRWLRPRQNAQAQQQEQVMAETVARTAQLLGLDDVLERYPRQLSGGQQQRVALGRAMVRRPGVFLLDEPLSQLDGRLRAELRHELHLLQRRLRATMIYVTHDQAEALTLADRLAVMDRGVVQQVDRPLVVYERPANRFVAGQVGWPPMNFVEGQLTPRNGQLGFAWDQRWFPVPSVVEADGSMQEGQAVTFGIRPEEIRLARAGEGGATLPVEVLLVEPLGHSWLITVRQDSWQGVVLAPGAAAGAEWLERRSPNASGRTRQPMVDVVFNMERAHFFDRTTGVALRSSRPAG